MVIFWTSNDLRGLPLYSILEDKTTDWYDPEKEIYRTTNPVADNRYVVDDEINNYSLAKFIDFIFMIYSNFEYCSSLYSFSNIRSDEVVDYLKENVIKKHPKLLLRARDIINISAYNVSYSTMAGFYNDDVTEFLDSLTAFLQWVSRSTKMQSPSFWVQRPMRTE